MAEIYILKNQHLEVHIASWGATIVRMITSDIQGKKVDVVLGLENVEDYQSDAYLATGAYLGAGIGRYANRIAGGQFHIDDKMYQLHINNGSNHLHGGICGFDQKEWKIVKQQVTLLELQYISREGEENYPGTLIVNILFELKEKELWINYRAKTDRNCYVNLTHHPYFNLDPESCDIKKHQLKLYTDKYLYTDELIPNGDFVQMEGIYDFTDFNTLQEVIEKKGGLDDCFVFELHEKIQRQAELFSEESGIKLYVCSDYPGLQVYTGRYLDVRNAKQGKHYGPYSGVALEAQYWPDSPNHPNFPSTLLVPEQEYIKTTIYGSE